ncbi:uncharacterized methyltransferase At1g78140, chloroplastic-like isoform X3 [Selaginella moellendorffii]|uniref:uncharacterized methyltransferase At1g78140, chloroplastic-like isoform X3 n=1 Tax=Selaginella moellendorffii TaxID=88036 RepID=UPI000D1CF0A2|nr:uncharacterized methyltransferase At1g78140, chloroplastic-like isoform X3 [Selaginella moellendorffii]|eukprot:XP_024527729.1 uncharacterized methyltransferase At1g78140, chloroplastic-like isoform X3 [Selaginella moellendorffii]
MAMLLLQRTSLSRFHFAPPPRPSIGRSRFKAFASAGTNVKKADKLELACPVCRKSFKNDDQPRNFPRFACDCCKKSYTSTSSGIIDLTISPTTVAPLGASFFQNPLLAFAYDRGYRDLFWIWNFPGYDQEFRMAQKLIEPVARGETIMDLSCAGGCFTRRFLASKSYKRVIAADYSQEMLEQCRGFLESDSFLDMSECVLLRADAGRLPLANSSVAAVHSGAAIHCWPEPIIAVAEISRVLRPQGLFVGSTFVFPEPPPPIDGIINPVREAIMQLQVPFKAWTQKELQQLVEAGGLIDWKSQTSGRYILFSATKPA